MKRLCLLLLLFMVANCMAQQPYTSLGSKNGLPTNEAYEVFCDSKGFVWMAHAQGISRFDGNRLVHYSHSLQNSLGISNIREDQQGRIWCRNFGGQIFFIERNKMQLLNAYDWKAQPTFPTIFIDQQNNLIASHGNGLFVYNINSKQSTILSPTNQPKVLNNFSLGICNGWGISIWNNDIYTLVGERLQKLTVNLKANHSLVFFPTIIGNARDTVYLLNQNKDTAIACYINNAHCIEGRSFPVPKGIYGIAQTSDGGVWLSSKSGAFALNDSKHIESTSVTSVCNDREGNTWFTSLLNGVGMVNNNGSSICQMPFQLQEADAMKSIALLYNQVAIGTNMGKLLLINESTKKHQIISEPFQNHIDALLYANNGQLYAGSAYLLLLNNQKNKLDTIASVSAVKDLDMDASGNVYVASSFSLFKVLPNKQKVVLRAKRCRAVKVCGQKVYAAFADGVFAFTSDGRMEELVLNKQSIYALGLAASHDSLLVNTIGNGACLFVDGMLNKQINMTNGLLSNQLKKARIVQGKLWLLLENGIECIGTSGNVQHYTLSNDMPSSNILDFIVRQQDILLMTANQLYSISLKQNNSITKPQVFIDAITVNNNDSIAYQQQYLGHQLNNIEFVLSGLSINSGSRLGFAYRLLGADTTWQLVSAAQYKVTFPALLPGKYTFEAKAIAVDGTVSNTVAYTFTINKPWWQQWWFYMVILLFAMAIVYLFLKLKMNAAAQRNRLLLEKLNLQSDLRDSMLTAIKSQMNPHFIFNALNTIQSYIYTNDENKASNYLGKFSDLIRMILDNSQRKTISLAKEIDMLQLYLDLELMRFENTLQASIHIDASINVDSIQLPPMLIQPYVENAIKHGLLHKANERVLKVNFSLSDNGEHLQVTIDDNGIGRAASEAINKHRRKSYASFSSFANQHRFDLLNQSISKKISLQMIDKVNEHGKPIGTTVIFLLPL